AREIAGSAAAPTARCRNCLRGNFIGLSKKSVARHTTAQFINNDAVDRSPIAPLPSAAMIGIRHVPAIGLIKLYMPSQHRKRGEQQTTHGLENPMARGQRR